MASILNVDKIRATGSTTDGLTVNSTGQVAQPALPFAMVSNTSGATVTPPTTVPFNNVISSRGISWDTSAFSFTVPVTGIYSFSGALRVAATRDFVWWAVGDNSGNNLQSQKLVLAHGSGSFTTVAGSMLASLTAGTTYKIIFNDSGGGSSVAITVNQTWMDVHLVG